MVSQTYIWIVLTFSCWLTLETSASANTTCYISGTEVRVNLTTLKQNNKCSCVMKGTCFYKSKRILHLSGAVGTLNNTGSSNGIEMTLILTNITTVDEYKKIHLLTCTGNKTGKLRFGKHTNVNFTTVFDRFQRYIVEQPCCCYSCKLENGGKGNGIQDFFCNCRFTNDSYNGAELRPVTSPTVTKTYYTTVIPTSALPQTTTKTLTSTSVQPNTTPQSAITQSTDQSESSTSPEKDHVSAVRQSEEDGIHTMAIVGGLVALVVLISSVIVFICLRRRKWNKKPPDSAESCITNPAYGEAQDDKKYAGLDNNGYEETENDVHTYAMAEDPKHEPKDDVDYNYANFGGQPKFQGLTPTLNPEKTEKHAPRPGFQAEKGNAYFLSEAGLPQNDDYDLAKDVTGFDAHGQLAVNSNSLPPLQDNYFVVKKSGQNSARTENSEAKLFVHERHDNDANERTEAMQSGTFLPGGDNYFLLEESDSAIAATGSKELAGIQGDDYFLLEQQTATEAKNAGNDVYELAHSRSHQNDVGDRKGHGKHAITPHRDVDTYDHVRVGHAQTNGIDDGVYDELRKQNVRYRPDDVDNDYDHC